MTDQARPKTTPNTTRDPAPVYKLQVFYIGDDHKCHDSITEWSSALEALEALGHDSARDGSFSWYEATCYRWVDGMCQERQFRVDIDHPVT